MNNENYKSREERRKILEQKENQNKKLEAQREELQRIIFSDEKKAKIKKKKSKGTNFILFLVILSALVFSQYMIYDSFNKVDQIVQIINAILISLSAITFVISFKKAYHKSKKAPAIITSLLLIILMTFNALTITNILTLPKQDSIPNLTNKSLVTVLNWADEKGIKVNQTYEYSDNTKKYNIITQDKKENTLTKNTDKINLVVSNGPDYNKEVIIQNMEGQNIDSAVKIIKENFLNNVTINYEENTDIKKDTIITQNKSGNIKRNDELTFTVSLGNKEDLAPITFKDLTNKTIFDALLYLNRNAIEYEIKYDFNDKIDKGKVIETNVKKGAKVSPGDKIIITVSKGKKITVPELKNMKLNKVTKWITENNLKINYTDKYDNTIKKGCVIEATYKKGDIIEEETTIGITVSKGKLKMPKFNSLIEFQTWATKYNIKNEIKEEFNDEIKQGDIIKFSVKTNKIIKNDDTIIAYVSKGKAVEVPDFNGKSKSEITSTCNNLKISCTFINEYSNSVKEGLAIKQSIQSKNKIAEGETIQITLATNNKNNVTTTITSKNNKTTANKTTNNSNSSNKTNNTQQSNNNSSQNNNTTCETVTFISGAGNNGAQTKQIIIGSNPKLKFSWNPVSACNNGNKTSGTICSSSVADGSKTSTCQTITITYVS